MRIEPIKDGNTDFALVKIKNSYPHCDKHGAMNKVSVFEDGGYWRCLQGLCRAGCNQIAEEKKLKLTVKQVHWLAKGKNSISKKELNVKLLIWQFNLK
jgi:hypothetical protein